jgi:RimJ/RimL family protein N-acetyltransferase
MIGQMTSWLTEIELSGFGVTLEPLRAQHAQELQDIVADGELWKLVFTFAPHPSKVEDYIAAALQAQQDGTAVPFLIRNAQDGKAVGTTRYCNIEHSNQRAEIGYTLLAQSVQRTFVNSACKMLLLQHLFDERQAIAVEFRTNWHNHPSRKAIARLGAKQDGVLRQHRCDENGVYRDTVVFSILNSEWPAVRKVLAVALKS